MGWGVVEEGRGEVWDELVAVWSCGRGMGRWWLGGGVMAWLMWFE